MRFLILIFVFLSCSSLVADIKNINAEELFLQMDELRFDISKPIGKAPMMLKIFPASKKKSIILNKNSLINGFFVSLIIYYKDDSSCIKIFSPNSSALRHPHFVEYNIENPIPIEFATHYIFNTIYQDFDELKIDQIESISMKIYIKGITENSVKNGITFVNKPLIFSKDEILKLIENYKIDPFVSDIQQIKIPQK